MHRLLAPLGDELRTDEIPGTAGFASIADWVHTDVCGWTLADLVDENGEAALVERELRRFVTSDAPVEFPTPALVGTVRIGG